jgi:hypothetical protein
MTGQTIRRRLEKIEKLMTPHDDVPKIRITWIYVEADDGYPTGRVLIVRDGKETEAFYDPAALRKHEIVW